MPSPILGALLHFFLFFARCGFRIDTMHRRTLNVAVLLLVGSFVLTSVYLARGQLQLSSLSALRQERKLELKAVENPAKSKALQVVQDGESFTLSRNTKLTQA